MLVLIPVTFVVPLTAFPALEVPAAFPVDGPPKLLMNDCAPATAAATFPLLVLVLELLLLFDELLELLESLELFADATCVLLLFSFSWPTKLPTHLPKTFTTVTTSLPLPTILLFTK